ncbi:hypothetical protein AAHE18_20G116700 [Arachis hypogaea]
MMFIKFCISASIRYSIPDCKNSSSKILASTLIAQLSSMRLTNVRGMHEHIMILRDIAAQLKALEVEISNSFLVHLILNSLFTHKLVQELGESALLVTNEDGKKRAHKKKEKGIASHLMKKEGARCFFCKKKGRMKKECPKFKVWLEKKRFHKEKKTDKK